MNSPHLEECSNFQGITWSKLYLHLFLFTMSDSDYCRLSTIKAFTFFSGYSSILYKHQEDGNTWLDKRQDALVSLVLLPYLGDWQHKLNNYREGIHLSGCVSKWQQGENVPP